MQLRDCPVCGNTFGAVNPYCVCTNCNHRFTALPTQILLAGKVGKTTEEQLLTRIAEYHCVPFLPSLDYPVSFGTAKMIGEKFARMHTTIPLMVDGSERFIVIDPEAPEMFEQITDMINHFPAFAVSPEQLIRRKINEHFGVLDSESTMDIRRCQEHTSKNGRTIGCTKVGGRCVLTMERSSRRLGDP